MKTIFFTLSLLLLATLATASSHARMPAHAGKKHLGEEEIVQSIFGTIQMAAKTLPYFENKDINIIAEGFHLLTEEMGNPRKPDLGQKKGNPMGSLLIMESLGPLDYRLGSIQDSFMNLDTFKIPKKTEKAPESEGDNLVRNLLKDVWVDMAREVKPPVKMGFAGIPHEVSRPKLKLLDETENLKRLETVNTMSSPPVKEQVVEPVPESKPEESKKDESGIGIGFKIFVTATLMLMVGVVAMYALKKMNKNSPKRERFDEERAPITKPYHFKGH